MSFWDKDNTSEWEQIEGSLDDQAQSILDEYEDDYEEEEVVQTQMIKTKSAYRLDKRETSVLEGATVRLAQARLYEMLIKHDLFAGVKEDPRALANVQKELKEYIVSRLEVLLGIREDERKKKDEPKQIVVESPFNDVEIEFLKALSFKGTKGASAQAQPKTLVTSEIKPLASQEREQHGLRPMVQQYEEEVEEEVEEEIEEEIIVPKRKPIKKSRPVVQNTSPQPSKSIKRIRRGEMTDAEAEIIARKELEQSSGLTKHPYEMTPKELKELAKRSSNKTKKIPAGHIPPATSAQTEQMLYQQQMMQQTQPGANGVNLLVQKLIHEKNKK